MAGSNFGYRSLGFGTAMPGGGIIFPGWSATVTMGNNQTKGSHFSYGFDISSIHGDNALGSISDNTLNGYEYYESDGTRHDDSTAIVARVVWHFVDGDTSLTGVRFRMTHNTLAGNKVSCGSDFGSNICGLTLTIGSTDFDFGDDTYNKSCSIDGGDGDHFWQASSNPFGSTTDGTTHSVSISAGTNPSPGAP